MPVISKVDLFAAIRRDSLAGMSVRAMAAKYQVNPCAANRTLDPSPPTRSGNRHLWLGSAAALISRSRRCQQARLCDNYRASAQDSKNNDPQGNAM